MSIVDVETAIRTWLVAGTGVPLERVFWAAQGVPRPSTTPYVVMSLGETSARGRWVTHRAAASPVPGADIETVAQSAETVTLSVQLIGGGACGAAAARELLTKAVRRLGLPGQRAAFRAVKVGVGTIGPVRAVPAPLHATVFEPRAVLEVRLHLTGEATELTTYIEFATAEGTVT